MLNSLNLILAAFWFALALVFFLVVERDPNRQGLLPVPVSWIALFLALYNLARWGSRRYVQRSGRALDEHWQRARRPSRRPDPDAAPDPAFDFSAPEPPPADAPPPQGHARPGPEQGPG
jgi:hypothetical protein